MCRRANLTWVSHISVGSNEYSGRRPPFDQCLAIFGGQDNEQRPGVELSLAYPSLHEADRVWRFAAAFSFYSPERQFSGVPLTVTASTIGVSNLVARAPEDGGGRPLPVSDRGGRPYSPELALIRHSGTVRVTR